LDACVKFFLKTGLKVEEDMLVDCCRVLGAMEGSLKLCQVNHCISESVMLFIMLGLPSVQATSPDPQVMWKFLEECFRHSEEDVPGVGINPTRFKELAAGFSIGPSSRKAYWDAVMVLAKATLESDTDIASKMKCLQWCRDSLQFMGEPLPLYLPFFLLLLESDFYLASVLDASHLLRFTVGVFNKGHFGHQPNEVGLYLAVMESTVDFAERGKQKFPGSEATFDELVHRVFVATLGQIPGSINAIEPLLGKERIMDFLCSTAGCVVHSNIFPSPAVTTYVTTDVATSVMNKMIVLCSWSGVAAGTLDLSMALTRMPEELRRRGLRYLGETLRHNMGQFPPVSPLLEPNGLGVRLLDLCMLISLFFKDDWCLSEDWAEMARRTVLRLCLESELSMPASSVNVRYVTGWYWFSEMCQKVLTDLGCPGWVHVLQGPANDVCGYQDGLVC
jgi:hypothetical protein